MRLLLLVPLFVFGACSSLIGSKRAVYLPILEKGAARADLEGVFGPPVAERPTAEGSHATYRYMPRPSGKREYITLDDHVEFFLESGAAFSNAGEGAILWPIFYGGGVVVAETVATTRVVLRMLSGKRFLAGRVYTVEADYDKDGKLVTFSRDSRRATAAEREKTFGVPKAESRHSYVTQPGEVPCTQ